MIIVNDILGAMTMKKKLSSLVRRSVNNNKSNEDILVELMFLIEDLDKNIDRIDSETSIQAGETA
jgi:hypothetical protein